jgi:hypothetical protein
MLDFWLRVQSRGGGRGWSVQPNQPWNQNSEQFDITVLRVESGYQAGQLDADRPDPDGRLALHRAFSALRTCA